MQAIEAAGHALAKAFWDVTKRGYLDEGQGEKIAVPVILAFLDSIAEPTEEMSKAGYDLVNWVTDREGEPETDAGKQIWRWALAELRKSVERAG